MITPFSIVPNRHKLPQISHCKHLWTSDTTSQPDSNGPDSTVYPPTIKCRLAASTSQSAKTLSELIDANAPVMLVFPVPPLPLMITSSFTELAICVGPPPRSADLSPRLLSAKHRQRISSPTVDNTECQPERVWLASGIVPISADATHSLRFY